MINNPVLTTITPLQKNADFEPYKPLHHGVIINFGYYTMVLYPRLYGMKDSKYNLDTT